MNRDFCINLDAKKTSQGFVQSFTQNIPVIDPPEMARSDSFPIRLLFFRQNLETSSQTPFYYIDPSTFSSAKFAGGIVGETPDGGTFTITGSLGGTTNDLAYNVSAATLQADLRANLTEMGNCTVTGPNGGPFVIDSGNLIPLDLTAISELAPQGSTVVIIQTQDANSGDYTDRWRIYLAKALPILKVDGWSALPSALVTPSVVQAGSSTANKVFRLSWNADAYGGAVFVSFLGASLTRTVGPIAYSANADDVAGVFALHPEVGTGGVSVVKNGPGDFTITCIGEDIDLSNTPTLSTSSNTLQVPIGLTGVVTVSTAGADDILNGADSATIIFEVEIGQSSGEKNTVAQMEGTLLADLILNTPGQATGNEDYLTSTSGVVFFGAITGYIGGASTDLDSISTTERTVPQLADFIHTTDSRRGYLLRAGTDAESSPDVIRPDDFNASTNAKVWESVS